MRDGADEGATNDWARFLREITSRDGWSVARLARESGIHRATIFRWLEGDEKPKRVTVHSVNMVADAAGVDRATALKAAGSILDDDDNDARTDAAIAMIEQSDLPPDIQTAMIKELHRTRAKQAAELRAIREKQAEDVREQVQTWINLAGGTQPA